MLAWLAYLFSALGIVAGVFLAVNLSVVAHDLHVSDTLAGVTLLALGNGAPDIFSTIAAMNKSSNNLAFGELIGAAAFITSVIPGSMALIRSFDVVKVSLIRDAVFLCATVGFLLFILHDGYLRLWYCVVLLAIYAIYIATVVGSHWWKSRQPEQLEGNGDNITRSTNNNNTHTPQAREADPLLAHHRSNESVESSHSTIRPQHQRTAADFTRWEEETRDVAPAEVIDYRHVSGQALSHLHLRHWARDRSARKANIMRRHHHDRPGNEDSRTTSPAAMQSSKPATKQGNIVRRVMTTLGWMNDDEERLDKLHIAGNIIMLPLMMVLKATISRAQQYESSDGEDRQTTDDGKGQDFKERLHDLRKHWLLLIQCFATPQFMLWIVARQLSKTASEMFSSSMICLGTSVFLAITICVVEFCFPGRRWYRLLCVPGFIASIGWISLLADEIVAVLTILGIISGIPDGIMGITVFAIGNSIDDWAADVSVARHDHPVMALSACFGGPLLNILLGLSISGISVIVKAARVDHELTAIRLYPSRSVFFVTISTMLNIGLLLAMMVWTRWKMTRLVGSVLTCFWVACTVVNVVIETRS